MYDKFAFSEVVRKLANVIRLGKITEVNGCNVRVKIGNVTTGWLPIISTAGKTSAWTPITKGEQVAVFAPYGEFSQAFILRSIHYNDYPAPDDENSVSLTTDTDVKVKCCKKLTAQVNDGFEFSSGNTNLKIWDGIIEISSGVAQIRLSSSGIQLICGSSTVDISDGNISLMSGSITTNPPVCKCDGGL